MAVSSTGLWLCLLLGLLFFLQGLKLLLIAAAEVSFDLFEELTVNGDVAFAVAVVTLDLYVLQVLWVLVDLFSYFHKV